MNGNEKPVDTKTIVYAVVVVLGAFVGTTGGKYATKDTEGVSRAELELEIRKMVLEMQNLPQPDTRRRIEALERYHEKQGDYERPTYSW